MTWSGASSGEHFVASNPPTGTYGSKTNVVVWPTSVNLQSEGADMSGVTDATAAWVKAQADLPSGGGDIYIPPGTLKMNAADANNNGLTVTGNNTRVKGSGRDATTINLSQSNLTWGIALTKAQQELADLTVNVLTGVTAPFWLIGMPGVPARSAQSVRFTRVNGSIAAGATIPVPPVGPPNDGVHSAVGAGIFAIGPDYQGTANFDAGNTHFEECKAQSAATTATTNLVSGYIIGNGTSGNVVAIYATDCQEVSCTFCIQLAGGGIRWFGGGTSNTIDTDIYVQHGGGDPVNISGLRGENGGRIIWGGNIGIVNGGVSLLDCQFDLYTPNVAIAGTVAGQVVKWNANGSLLVVGGRMSTAANNTTFGLCTDGGLFTTLTTIGLSTDVDPYPAPNTVRYRRTVLNPIVGLDAGPLAAGTERHDFLVSAYNGIVTQGSGFPAIYQAPAVQTGRTAAVASVATITSPNDGAKHIYRISGVVNITTHGSESINLQVSYTDDNGTARTATIPLMPIGGTDATAANAAGPWVGDQVISVNPNTAITILTAGTFTGATYNVAGTIENLL